MAFEIPDEVIKALKDKKISAEAKAQIDALKLEEPHAKAFEGAATLLQMYADKVPDKAAFGKAFAEAVGFPLPVKEVVKEVERAAAADPLANLPEDARKAVEAALKERDEKIEASAKAQKEALEKLEAAETARKLDSMTSRAKAFDFLGMKAEELGGIFMNLSEKAPDDFAKLEKSFRSLKAKMEEVDNLSELFKKHGTGGEGNAETATAQVDKLVTERMKAHTDETREVALLAVMKANPDKYDKAQAEQKSA